MPEREEIINGKYRILDRLGAGAMGVVFTAVHMDTEKQVALKWLNPALSSLPSSVERFKREAKLTGRIHHPNVVAVHDCGEHEGQLYLVMEYLHGRTLRARMAEAPAGRMLLDEALGVLFPVMRGVAAAHAALVLHRDIKPENVFLAESPDGLDPIAKVLDFGLAKMQQDVSFKRQLSMPGSVLGTYQYMAPEQLQPRVEVDARVDVYALGAMLYEMLTGAPPYRADNPVDLVLQLHDGEPPLLTAHVPELSDELSHVVAKALARARDERFASVEDFAFALEPFTTQHQFRGSGARNPSAVAAAAPAPLPTPKPLSLTQRIELGQRAAGPGAARTKVAARTRLLEKRAMWAQLGIGLALQCLSPASGETRADESRHEEPPVYVEPQAEPVLPMLHEVPAAPPESDWEESVADTTRADPEPQPAAAMHAAQSKLMGALPLPPPKTKQPPVKAAPRAPRQASTDMSAKEF
ncbi:MAG: hypothetical protein RL701_4819 [Pseudomonadota bacterium]